MPTLRAGGEAGAGAVGTVAGGAGGHGGVDIAAVGANLPSTCPVPLDGRSRKEQPAQLWRAPRAVGHWVTQSTSLMLTNVLSLAHRPISTTKRPSSGPRWV